MNKLITVFGLALFLGSAAYADGPAAPANPVTSSQAATKAVAISAVPMRPLTTDEIGRITPGEYLAFQAPSPQWHLIKSKDDVTSRITALVPEGQTADAWDEEIIVSQFKGAAHVGIPALEQLFLDSDRKTCGGVFTYTTGDGLKNGFLHKDENEMCTGPANVAHISLYEFTQGQNDLYLTIWHLRGKKLDGASDAQKYADSMLKPRSALLWLNNIVCDVSDKDTSCPEWYTKSLVQQSSATKSP